MKRTPRNNRILEYICVSKYSTRINSVTFVLDKSRVALFSRRVGQSSAEMGWFRGAFPTNTFTGVYGECCFEWYPNSGDTELPDLKYKPFHIYFYFWGSFPLPRCCPTFYMFSTFRTDFHTKTTAMNMRSLYVLGDWMSLS